MNRANALRQQLVFWGLILGLWFLMVLAFAGQVVVVRSIPWPEAVRISLLNWFPWVILAPLTVWLANRFPFESAKLPIAVPVHILGCLAAILAAELLSSPVRPAPPGFPRRPNPIENPASPEFNRGGQQFRRRGPNLDPQPNPNRPPPLFPPDPEQPRGPRPLPLPESRPDVFLNGLMLHAQVNLPVYWVIVTITQALRLHRRSQERETRTAELEARLAEAKILALRMQLHPHFLFNTLNAISTLVHRDPQAADEMIVNLSELLRVTLDTKEQEITLRRELAFLDRYLEIQRVRFGERLRVEKEIDASMLEVLVPTLILQPLAENAIRHGLEPRPEGGLLQVRAHPQGGSLRLVMRDNGAAPRGATKPQSGIGISNTEARLRELYGGRASLVLSSGADEGFSVEIILPCRFRQSAELAPA